MTRRGLTLLVATGLAVVLAVVGLLLPVPYVELSPGPTYDTLGSVAGQSLIQIEGHPTFPTSGHLNLTTVGVSPGRLDLGTALRGWLDRRVAVVPRDEVYPPGRSDAQVQAENAAEMRDSQQHATTAALRQLGIPVPVQVTVGQLSPGSPAAGSLRMGDIVLAVDAAPVASTGDLRARIGAHRPGETVMLTLRRADVVMTVTVLTQPAPDNRNRPVVGFIPQANPQYPFTVRIRLQDVGGPSAGLMFALGIIDRLSAQDITGGRFVAGTGTIEDDGKVGPIGGIQQKIIAAHDKGATVFLTPTGDCAEARQRPPPGIRLVRVDDLTGALTALQQVRAGTGSPSC